MPETSQKPLISVIMPLYNAEKYVGEGIESILAQTEKDFELIIIDDGSSDASFTIANEYAAKDSRIVILKNEANMGAALTRNRGLEMVRGEFIAFTDADDICSPERLAKELAFLKVQPKVDLCGSYYAVFGNISSDCIKGPLTHDEIFVHLLFGNPLAPAVMMRREPYERSGVKFKNVVTEDYLFWANLSDHMQMANIPEVLYHYRRWDNQTSTRRFDRQIESAKIIQRDLLFDKLGIALSENEFQAYTRFNFYITPLNIAELKIYRNILTKIYKANIKLKVYNKPQLHQQLVKRYKQAAKELYPTWRVKIMKRLFLLKLLRT